MKLTEEQLAARKAKREAKEKEAEAQRTAENRQFRIEEMRKVRPTTPTYTFKIGDLVSVGNIAPENGLVVTQVFDDGQFYECAYDYMGSAYGRPKREIGSNLWHWYDLQPFRTVEQRQAGKPFSSFDETRLSFTSRQIDGLLMCYYRWNLDMSPEYQRGNVWSQAEKELLLESIFSNRDIGKFVIVMRPYAPWPAPHAEILDGKQRLTTLIEFFENRLTYKGILFNDLHWRDQCHFESYLIGWAELGEKTTRKQKLEYFLKLNVAGVPQSPEHIKYVEFLLKEENDKNQK